MKTDLVVFSQNQAKGSGLRVSIKNSGVGLTYEEDGGTDKGADSKHTIYRITGIVSLECEHSGLYATCG